jgi:hypothetical protein
MRVYLSELAKSIDFSSLAEFFSPEFDLENLLDEIEAFDKKLSDELTEKPCPWCGGTVATAPYFRFLKIPGGVKLRRLFYSLCCTREGCRKRCRPPSLLWFGRLTTAVPLLLITEFLLSSETLTDKTLDKLSELSGAVKRTLFRWRQTFRAKLGARPQWLNYLASYVASLNCGIADCAQSLVRTLARTLLVKNNRDRLGLIHEFIKLFESSSPYLAELS